MEIQVEYSQTVQQFEGLSLFHIAYFPILEHYHLFSFFFCFNTNVLEG